MKRNMDHMENLDVIKENVTDYIQQINDINKRLTEDLSKDTNSIEVQSIIKELICLFKEHSQGIDMGENYWSLVIDGYLSSSEVIEATDKIYGTGASKFIGKALTQYFALSYV